MSEKHTETPWSRSGETVYHADRVVAACYCGGHSRSECEANADFIALAANCHDELVAACKEKQVLGKLPPHVPPEIWALSTDRRLCPPIDYHAANSFLAFSCERDAEIGAVYQMKLCGVKATPVRLK